MSAKVQPPKPDQPASDTYLEVMVAFREDNLEAEDFRVPDDDADAPRDGEAPPADDTPDDG